MEITKKDFGTVNGKKVYLYTLENENGMKLSCTNFGCIVTEVYAPDRKGVFENVVLGFDHVDDYLQYKTYFGAIIGRVAGRIRGSEFELDGHVYKLPATEGKNHLHGGVKGLHERVWAAKEIKTEDAVGVQFSYLSEDGEEGYPGNVQLTTTYLLNNENQWVFTCKGITDKKTLLNITNHTYFNLSGHAKTDILNHQLTMKSDRFLELNEELLPTGKMLPTQNTVFDFTQGRKIIDGRESTHPQNILVGHGYDHPFLLSKNHDEEIVLLDELTGRVLTVETNQPSVVLYTGNQISDNFNIQEGIQGRKYLGVCLETQGLPDAIHHPKFPSVILDKDETYELKTTYTFGVQ